LAICPWNKFASLAKEQKLAAKAGTDLPSLADLLRLDDADFCQFFAGTPVRRVGYERFLRNVLIAAGNSGDAGLMPMVTPFLDHLSALLRAMAIWALRQLAEDYIWQGLREDYLPGERDQSVRREWQDY
jgi:epoxyqueuosine reductase